MAETKDLQEQLDQATVELSIANEKIEVLEKEKASLKADLAEKQTALDDALSINADLTDQVEKLSKETTDDSTKKVEKKVDHNALSFENDGRAVGFNYPKTVWKKQPITAEDIVANPELQAQLIAAHHGILKFSE